MTPEAFLHLPRLLDRVKHPETSDLRVTPEVMALWDQRARDMGRPADWRLADAEREVSRQAMLAALRTQDTQDLWVYGYGSLMWDPGFHFCEVRLADLPGYQRCFSLRSTIGRGSPERPGLMLSLQPGAGVCTGLAFRIRAEVADAESEILWRREMLRGSYCPEFVSVDTPQGTVSALAFTSNCAHQHYVGALPDDETAAMIARGEGTLGTNRAYLEQLTAQLAALEIEDAYVTRLMALVVRQVEQAANQAAAREIG